MTACAPIQNLRPVGDAGESGQDPGTSPGLRDIPPFLLGVLKFCGFAAIVYAGLLALLGWLVEHPPGGPQSESAYLLKEIAQNLQYPIGYHGHLTTRLREADHAGPVDILVVGSSHAYRGFDPRVFQEAGWRVFVLGSSAQTHFQTRVLLERYLARLAPRMVIYEVYPHVFSIDGVESALDLIANGEIDGPLVRMAFRLNHVKVYHALVYGVLRRLLHLGPPYAEPLRRGPDQYVAGGYVERIGPGEKDPNPSLSPAEWRPVPRQYAAFAENLRLIDRFNIPVRLVQAPWPPATYRQYAGAAAHDERMRAAGEYSNFNHLLELDENRDFMDDSHMNSTGVGIFNRDLIQRLLPAQPGESPRRPPAAPGPARKP